MMHIACALVDSCFDATSVSRKILAQFRFDFKCFKFAIDLNGVGGVALITLRGNR